LSEPTDVLTDYLQSLFGIEPLPTEEEHKLSEQIQKGNKAALDKLVKHNLRFVVYILRSTTAWTYGKMPVEDLISMGNEHLVIAAKRWVPKNNARFATYARSFILKGVRRDMDNTANVIRMPVNIMEAIKKMNYNERALSQVLGRKPKLNEIATMMGVEVNKVRQLQNYLTYEPMSLDSINETNTVEDHDE
jgi:DNA-directed RNA polymerase sigma subunit (sigma70/sigma32)